jgi:hypothetical protein
MRPTPLALLTLFFLCAGPQLLAQSTTNIALSANVFYRGDSPGSYTITCPSGMVARVTALTKSTDVPITLLANPTESQPANGTVFSPAIVTNQQVFIGTFPQATAATGVGILDAKASCVGIAPSGTSPTSFTITLAGITKAEEETRTSYALKANALTLPRLTTSEQATLPPQKVGNVVYNIEQQKMAVHDGTNWQYVGPAEAGQFQNMRSFPTGTQVWIVPAGVTRILVEAWGGGQGGDKYRLSNSVVIGAKGGNAGAYTRGFMAVTPGQSLTLTIGAGGVGGINNFAPGDGRETKAQSSTASILAVGGINNGASSSNYFGTGGALIVGGGRGAIGTIAYGQKSATEYVLLIKCGDGGTAYGAQASGAGEQFALLNSSTLLYTSGGADSGSFPGGGGGAGYNSGKDGADGFLLLHW